jgi:predicted dehydrogenase
MAQVPGVELVAVVDPRGDEVRPLAEELGVPLLADAGDLGDDVQAVSVAAPTSLHHQLVCPLLERGMHVMVEKPIAAAVDEGRAMVALAEDRGLVLRVGHIERFNPVMSVLREMQVRPRFIEAHRLAAFNFRTLDVSVVLDLMIHDIDIVLDLVDAPLVRVDGVGGRVLSPQVDIANARLTFENGCVANVTASRVSFEPLRRMRVFCDEAFVSMDFGTRRAFIAGKAEGFDPASLSSEDQARFEPAQDFRSFVQQGLLDLKEIDMDAGNPLLSELTAFIEAVRGNSSAGATAQHGLSALEVAYQVMDQIDAHEWK